MLKFPSRRSFYIIIIITLINLIDVVGRSCPASLDTKVYVSSCPTNKMDWDDAARKKNCSAVQQDCTAPANFQYHCLANSFQTKLIEICGIPIDITFPVCAEYNEGGNLVQENHFTDCSGYNPPCPSRYPSTESYKYVECFNVTQQKTTVTVLTSMPKEVTTTTAYLTTNSKTTEKDADGNVSTDTVEGPSTKWPHPYNPNHGQLIVSLVVMAGVVVPVFSIILIARIFARDTSARDGIHKHKEECSREKGIETDPEKLSAVRNWPAPTNIKQLRQFLGFVGYYRRFIRTFVRIVAPMNALLKGHGTNTKKKGTEGKPKSFNWTWAGAEEESFRAIKQKLLEPPILGYANYQLPFIVHTI
ncbi:uncharacterized protein LOC130053600 [Ostrea edulis]|uniref:uncharacterized protein LOC130053600 n=1 Tax=Ostrea edulis TaxID=37623 RepID=UPI0024AFF719|nr:uncharacterized protein LOC130053600 [Ostrea edulis]